MRKFADEAIRKTFSGNMQPDKSGRPYLNEKRRKFLQESAPANRARQEEILSPLKLKSENSYESQRENFCFFAASFRAVCGAGNFFPDAAATAELRTIPIESATAFMEAAGVGADGARKAGKA